MSEHQLYKKYARFYDKIYNKKKYKEEVEFILSIIKKFNIKGKNILDMACGTGTHAKEFAKAGFKVTGVDLNKEMLEIAKTKAKNCLFLNGKMQSFESKKKFDVILCLFTSINYNKNISDLEETLKRFYKLSNKNGIIIFDLGIIKGEEENKSGVFINTYVENNLELARINQWKPSKEKENIFNANSLIFIKENGKLDFGVDEHELGIFSVEEIKNLMEQIGFNVRIYNDFTLEEYNKKSKRPVFVGQK